MKKEFRLILFTVVFFSLKTNAQVNSVEFGKNRVQYQKFNWKFYQTENFNTYFSQDGLALGKYVAQVAEEELSGIEEFVEYGLQRRANIVVYNNFDEFQQSNIGLGIDWQNTGGVTKLVNNKIILFFDGNHENLKRQVRQGIAKVLVDNVLFGDDLGEFAANQALLDLPLWLTDGYIAYAAENWSAQLDDDLKSALLSGRYNNFYQFAHEKPLLAGHAFWRWVGDKYGKNKTTYMLYLARIYRNLNAACNRVTKQKKFKTLLTNFMTEESQKYLKDIRGRRVAPKGQLSVSEYIKKKDFIRFNANPVPRNMSYAVVEFKQGKYSIVLNENFTNRKVLVKFGARSREDEKNPNYPIMAWDGKGTRLAVLYWEKGDLKLFVYDLVNRVKISKTNLDEQFSQIEDMKYMLDANTLLFSAVKSGQTDIFVYKIDKGTVEQITNDVYDDLDASFVAFPNKTGIIFSSNRPSGTAASSDDSLPHNRYNIFLVDNWNKSEFKQISQLTDMKQGDARLPSQYNTSHFTFVSNENGIANRYAGFFRTERAGLDTLVFIGGDVLRNPTLKDVDSLLKEWDKPDIDSVGFVSVTQDSTYVFPITNYQSSLLETRTAGDQQQVSEIVRQGDYKFLYRLKVDENALRRRNISARPTEYMKKVMEEEKFEEGKLDINVPDPTDTSGKKQDDFFENEFKEEKKDSTQIGNVVESVQVPGKESVLKSAKLFEYRPPKFFNDYVVAGFNNNVLITRYQTYAGGSGPIQLANGDPFNGMIRVGTSDLMEDWKFAGGFRLSTDLKNNEYIMSAQYLKKRLDYNTAYYRSTQKVGVSDQNGNFFNGKLFTNLYQLGVSYPFDRIRSIRLNGAFRSDKVVILADDLNLPPATLEIEDIKKHYAILHAEYVYDDAINPALNIWKGLRYKFYFDWNSKINKESGSVADNPYSLNVGGDGRLFIPIYRNFIWALRGAFDLSWGTQKIIYYAGGVDTDLFPKFNDANKPDPDIDYAFQSLAVNLRGFNQNVANGNNAAVINSELRLPLFSTLFNKPINNAFLRNFQLVQFFDLGTAWNGKFDKIERPSVLYSQPGNPVVVKIKAGGIGPFAGGYGFGVRSTILGYFLRLDTAWEMNGVFKGKPLWYFAMGLDF